MIGLIKAIQLDYSEADKHLMNAIRKAPQNTAVGFKQHVSDYCILVAELISTLVHWRTNFPWESVEPFFATLNSQRGTDATKKGCFAYLLP